MLQCFATSLNNRLAINSDEDTVAPNVCGSPAVATASVTPTETAHAEDIGAKRGHDTKYLDGKTLDRIKLQTRRVSRRFLKRV